MTHEAHASAASSSLPKPGAVLVRVDDPHGLLPVHGERTPHPVVALASDIPANSLVEPHAHRRGQLLHAIQGVMLIRAAGGSWVVPPGCAVWVPPGVTHEIRMAAGPVAMRTVFVEPGWRGGLWPECQVVQVSTLLRELVMAATDLPLDYPAGGREEHLLTLILDEIERAPPLAFHVPMPRHDGLLGRCRAFISHPEQAAVLNEWAQALHMHPRTLARLFQRETGHNFGAWCRHTRLLLSVPMLARGVTVLEVALAHGYDSPSAFTAAFKQAFGRPPSAYRPRAQNRTAW